MDAACPSLLQPAVERISRPALEHTLSLVIRALIGLILAYFVGFIIMLLGSVLSPPIGEGDLLTLAAKIGFIGFGATIGATGAWFNLLLDRRKTSLLVASALLGALLAGFIAHYWSAAFTGDSDNYIRVREVTQSTVVGAAIGANVLPVLMGLMAPRHWRS